MQLSDRFSHGRPGGGSPDRVFWILEWICGSGLPPRGVGERGRTAGRPWPTAGKGQCFGLGACAAGQLCGPARPFTSLRYEPPSKLWPSPLGS